GAQSLFWKPIVTPLTGGLGIGRSVRGLRLSVRGLEGRGIQPHAELAEDRLGKAIDQLGDLLRLSPCCHVDSALEVRGGAAEGESVDPQVDLLTAAANLLGAHRTSFRLRRRRAPRAGAPPTRGTTCEGTPPAAKRRVGVYFFAWA